MVNKKKDFIAVIIIFTALLVFNKIYSQNNLFFEDNKKWGIVIQPIVYNKAFVSKDYGATVYDSQYSPSLKVGILYDFFQNRQLSIKSGLLTGLMPVINGKFKLLDSDIFFEDDFYFDESPIRSSLILSLPIQIEYKNFNYKNSIWNFGVGIQLNLIPESSIGEGVFLFDDVSGENREVYASYADSNSSIDVDLVFTYGIYFKIREMILNTSLLYHHSLKNKFEGEYQFGNLIESEPTRGEMNISGNYFGISFTAYFKKKTKKKKRKNIKL